MHLMVVGAHCGDAEAMAGALIARYTAAGHRATIVHMTRGEMGHPNLPPEAYAAQKEAEALAAARILGAGVRFLPFRDTELTPSEAPVLALCDLVRELGPHAVITHWRGGGHPDHDATHDIVQAALFRAALPAIRRPQPAHRVSGLFFAENWEDPHGFDPDTHVDVTASWDTYLEALQAYELFRPPGTQPITRFRFTDYYTALATVRGCLAGCQRAVALMRPRPALTTSGPWLPGFPG